MARRIASDRPTIVRSRDRKAHHRTTADAFDENSRAVDNLSTDRFLATPGVSEGSTVSERPQERTKAQRFTLIEVFPCLDFLNLAAAVQAAKCGAAERAAGKYRGLLYFCRSQPATSKGVDCSPLFDVMLSTDDVEGPAGDRAARKRLMVDNRPRNRFLPEEKSFRGNANVTADILKRLDFERLERVRRMIGWSADFKELAETALSDWPDLTESELKLLCAVTSGQIAYCGPSLSDDDPLNDPRLAASWGNERCIRAPLILALCLDPGATGYIELAGIRIHAARIEGDLDLRSAKISFPLALLRCQIKNRPDLTMAQVESLNLSGSVTPGLLAGQITVCGSLDMASGFLSEGAVFLDGTSVGGNLNCSAGRFTTGANPLEAGMPYGAVLFAPGLRVSGVVFLSGGFCAEGSVVLTGAEIGGQLTCDEGNFVNPGGRALIADALTVGGAAFFRGARASGELRLNGARVRVLECARGRFVNPGGYALNADGIRVEGSVRLGRFYTQGEVCFVGASVGGSLECDSGHFTNPGRISLNCDHFRVDRSVYLRVRSAPVKYDCWAA